VLALLGFLTVATLFVLIVSRLASPLVALIAVPIAAALAGGFGLATAKFIVTGLQQIAPVAAMFVFAILYFGIITDAGTLEPVINAILRAVGARPARVVAGSALLALLVHLDGSGAVTFLVAVPAMLPLYDRLQIDRRVLACVVSMAAGVNFLPWTGPMIRASASLHIPVAQLFRPLVPVQLDRALNGRMVDDAARERFIGVAAKVKVDAEVRGHLRQVVLRGLHRRKSTRTFDAVLTGGKTGLGEDGGGVAVLRRPTGVKRLAH